MMFYTYIHYRKDDDQPFYIGKGQNNRHQSKAGRNNYWMNVANKHDWYSSIIAYWTDENDAYEHEIFLIDTFKNLGYKLTNLSTGGEGANGPKSEQHRLAVKSYAQNRTPEHQAKLNAASKLPRRKYKRPPMSAEQKASRVAQCKQNAANRIGTKVAADTKDKIRQAITGMKWCNNGIINKKFKPELMPVGYKLGMIAHNVK